MHEEKIVVHKSLPSFFTIRAWCFGIYTLGAWITYSVLLCSKQISKILSQKGVLKKKYISSIESPTKYHGTIKTQLYRKTVIIYSSTPTPHESVLEAINYLITWIPGNQEKKNLPEFIHSRCKTFHIQST